MTGARIRTEPDRLAITHGLAAAAPPLSRSIGIAALDQDDNQVIVPMLRKGTPLPALKQDTFRTARDVRPGEDDDVLHFHVLEGDGPVDSMRHVGWLSITGQEVQRAIPTGTPVEIKLRVDTSRGVVAAAYVPLLDLTVENVLSDKYRPEVDPELVREDLSARSSGPKMWGIRALRT